MQVPEWFSAGLAYEVQIGSVSYGVSSDNSDVDIYGFAIPPKYDVFPHLNGTILGFGEKPRQFQQLQTHHIVDDSTAQKYDITIYGIVKYFQLCMENNPNMLDSLFVPRRCVFYTTSIGEMVRENRKLFLHKGAFHKLKGYAYQQKVKIENKTGSTNETRQGYIRDYGYDVKYGYHLVRLVLQAEQILVEHDLDLERNREQLKAIRRGEWTLDYLLDWFENKERSLEMLYATSTLREKPDEDAIGALLRNCLEQHYGDLNNAVIQSGTLDRALNDIQDVINRYRLGTSTRPSPFRNILGWFKRQGS